MMSVDPTDDRLIAAVAELRQRFGGAVLRDRRKLTNILSDMFPEACRSVWLLGIAVGDGIPGELQRARPETLHLERQRLAKRMEDVYAIRPDLAQWTVDIWCRMLGLSSPSPTVMPADAVGDTWDDAFPPSDPAAPPSAHASITPKAVAGLIITAIATVVCIWLFRGGAP